MLRITTLAKNGRIGLVVARNACPHVVRAVRQIQSTAVSMQGGASANTDADASADVSALPEGDFHKLADKTLNSLEEVLQELEDLDGFDLRHSMGVLTVSLGKAGTYVLNKQTPNRQIWWSSPLSGPRRYQWDAGSRRWKNTRDGHDMLNALRTELLKLTGTELAI